MKGKDGMPPPEWMMMKGKDGMPPPEFMMMMKGKGPPPGPAALNFFLKTSSSLLAKSHMRSEYSKDVHLDLFQYFKMMLDELQKRVLPSLSKRPFEKNC